jgi:hypothetical protein
MLLNFFYCWYVTEFFLLLVCYWIFSIIGMLLNFFFCWYVTEFFLLLVCYWIFSIVGMLLNFCYYWYVTEFSHVLAMLLLFIISVYLENNIVIIQLFLIIRVYGSLFKLCLKGSPRMYLLHVLNILRVFVKNVQKRIKYFGQQIWCQEKARMQNFAPFTPDKMEEKRQRNSYLSFRVT